MNGPASISAYLSSSALKDPNKLALIYPGGELTYGELEASSNRCANGLLKVGVGLGTRTVLMVKPGPEFLILAFALFKVHAVPVLVDPGVGWKNLRRCLARAHPEAFIGTILAHAARILFGWASETLRTNVTVGWPSVPHSLSYSHMIQSGGPVFTPNPFSSEEIGAIVFTSGSTGPPKGVVYTHRMFCSQAQLLRDHFAIQPGEIDLATFPLFALFDVALGMTTVFPRMNFSRPGSVNPAEILRPIQKYGVTHMFASPALLDRVGQHSETLSIKLPTLKRILSAGAPVSAEILKRISKTLAEEADIHTPYGATEALPVCSIAAREVLEESESTIGQGICVGPPLHGVHLAIIKITDEAIPSWSEDLLVKPGDIGEMVVWGPNVSEQYYELPEANELAKIGDGTGVVRHRMGDLGYTDSKGRVWFCGRKSQRVMTSSGTLFTIPCESIFNQHPAVRRTALVGTGRPPHQLPVLCVELKQRERRTRTLEREILLLGKSHSHTRQIETLLFHPAFPVDIRHNAKIFREELALWAARKLA